VLAVSVYTFPAAKAAPVFASAFNLAVKVFAWLNVLAV
jgi:hypothetical protein